MDNNYTLNNIRDGEPIVGQKPNGIDVTNIFSGSKYYLIFFVFIIFMFILLMNNILNLVLLLVCYISFVVLLLLIRKNKKSKCSLNIFSDVVYVTKKIVRGKDSAKKYWNVFYSYFYNGQVYYFTYLIPLMNNYPDVGSKQEIFINPDNPKEGLMDDSENKAIKNIFRFGIIWGIIFGVFVYLSSI